MLLGHEAAGIVEALGDGVDDLAAGDRVVMTFLPRCGDCPECATDGRLPCRVGSAANGRGHARRRRHRGCTATASPSTTTSASPRSPATRWSAARRWSAVDADVPPEVAALLGCAVLTGGGAVVNAGRPAPG